MNAPTGAAKKRRALALVAACLCLVVAACGGGARSAGPVPTVSVDTEPPTATWVASESSAEDVRYEDRKALFQLWFVRHFGPGKDGPCCNIYPTWRTAAQLGIPEIAAEGANVSDYGAGAPEVLETLVEALIAGPSRDEHVGGFGSALDPDARLIDVSLGATIATIDISSELDRPGDEFSYRGGPQLDMAQIVFTLTQFLDVQSVEFKRDGRRVPVVSASEQGGDAVLDRPATRGDLASGVP